MHRTGSCSDICCLLVWILIDLTRVFCRRFYRHPIKYKRLRKGQTKLGGIWRYAHPLPLALHHTILKLLGCQICGFVHFEGHNVSKRNKLSIKLKVASIAVSCGLYSSWNMSVCKSKFIVICVQILMTSFYTRFCIRSNSAVLLRTLWLRPIDIPAI